MIKDVNELKSLLNKLKEENLKFEPHFYKKIKDRPYLNEKLILEGLKNTEKLLGFQTQTMRGEKRYRIGIKLSNNYNLIIVSEIKNKHLNIITAWKTNRKWQKAIQK